MKQVVVHPERCVGCMQCMPACAAAHSKSKTLFGAVMEKPLPPSSGSRGRGFVWRRFPEPVPSLRSGALPDGLSAGSDLSFPGHRNGAHQSRPVHQLRLVRHGLSFRRHTLSSGLYGGPRQNRGREVRQLRGAADARTGPRVCGSVHGKRADVRRIGRGAQKEDGRDGPAGFPERGRSRAGGVSRLQPAQRL